MIEVERTFISASDVRIVSSSLMCVDSSVQVMVFASLSDRRSFVSLQGLWWTMHRVSLTNNIPSLSFQMDFVRCLAQPPYNGMFLS